MLTTPAISRNMTNQRLTPSYFRQIILAVALLCLVHASPSAEPTKAPPNAIPTFRLGPVTLKLDPALVGPVEAAGNAEAAALSMELLLPNLEPRTAANREEFTKLGWNRKVRILLQSPSRFMPLHSYIYGNEFGPALLRDTHEVASEVPGFRKFANNYDARIYVAIGRDFFMRCQGVGYGPSPSCETVDTIWNAVEIKYSYSIDFVNRAEEFDIAIRKLLFGLKISNTPEKRI